MMNRKNKSIYRISMLSAVILAASVSLCGCKVGGKELVLDTGSITAFGGVFSINGKKCTVGEAKVYLANYKNLYSTSFGIDMSNYEAGDITTADYVKNVTLEELARIYCMDQMADEQEITLSDEETEQVEEAAATYYSSLSEADLAFMDVKEKDLIEYYSHYALASKLYQTMLSGEAAEISEDEARVMKAEVIFVSDEEKEQEVESLLEEEKDFASIASSYSELDKSEVTIDRDTYSDEINDVIYSLDDDEVSDPIKTDEGTWFFKITNKYVEDLTEAHREELQEAEQTKAFREAYEAFQADSMYHLNESKWNDITLDDAADVTTADFFSVYDELTASKQES